MDKHTKINADVIVSGLVKTTLYSTSTHARPLRAVWDLDTLKEVTGRKLSRSFLHGIETQVNKKLNKHSPMNYIYLELVEDNENSHLVLTFGWPYSPTPTVFKNVTLVNSDLLFAGIKGGYGKLLMLHYDDPLLVNAVEGTELVGSSETGVQEAQRDDTKVP